MLTKMERAKEKWGGSHQLIDGWLNERSDLLVRYCQLAGLPPYERNDNALPDSQDIKEFCQILVDYISAGHFEVYDRVASQCAINGKATLELAEALIPTITVATDDALQFNDTYAALSDDNGLEKFDFDLANLGQRMEERFASEDQLINTLHDKHIDHLNA